MNSLILLGRLPARRVLDVSGMKNTTPEIKTVDLHHVRGGIGQWGQFGLDIARSALQGLSQGGGQGAAQGALGAVKQGLGSLLG